MPCVFYASSINYLYQIEPYKCQREVRNFNGASACISIVRKAMSSKKKGFLEPCKYIPKTQIFIVDICCCNYLLISVIMILQYYRMSLKVACNGMCDALNMICIIQIQFQEYWCQFLISNILFFLPKNARKNTKKTQ
jgi:hypothetical protein